MVTLYLVQSVTVGPSCGFCLFFNDTATTEIYTLSLHDALPISLCEGRREMRKTVMILTVGALLLALSAGVALAVRSEEHTSELQSRQYLVCRLLLEKKQRK